MPDPRWCTADTGTSHAVHNEMTSWAQDERYMVLIFMCGRVDNEFFVTSDNGRHCKSCERVVRSQHD